MEAHSFKVGDKAVHPAHGVGEVTGIDVREIAGSKAQFYVLKIVESGIKTFYKEVCLLDQPYVHDGGKTVAQALKEAEGKVGGPIRITGFYRFALGEGIEKEESDFAAEVMAAAKG